jgi:hypothetical protein
MPELLTFARLKKTSVAKFIVFLSSQNVLEHCLIFTNVLADVHSIFLVTSVHEFTKWFSIKLKVGTLNHKNKLTGN